MKKLLPLFIVLILAACGGGPNTADAPDAVVDYLNALVEGQTEQATTLACSEYEEGAQREASGYEGVDATLDGVTCALASPEASGTEVLVSCEGAIVATYGDEDQRIELDERRYVVNYEAGAWRVCGFGE
jgi:hypothetical protein